MSIINTFKTSDDLYKAYPKTKYFTLKDIFSDFWYDFLEYADNHDLTIRNVVKVDVERMMLCKTIHLGCSTIVALNATILLEHLIPAKAGFATLKCPSCGTIMIFFMLLLKERLCYYV